MKTVSTAFLVICSFCLFAHDYQNICPPGKLFFKDFSNNLKAFRMDSAVLSGTNDTLFYSYRTIIDTGGPCRDTVNGSILGRKILKKANGLFCFFNRHQDSVFIQSQASLNQSWKFFNLPSNNYIEAQVTSLITDSIAGTTDLMKVITFQAKDNTGNNITHPLNGKSIRLSKDYGLATMLDVYRIPDDTVIYTLAGISNLNWGITGNSYENIYNYDVGDVFHYKITTNWLWFYQSTIINRIIGKTDYGGKDSVSYQVEYCQRWDGYHPPYYDVKSDTVTIKYIFMQLELEQPFLLPEEFTSTDYPPYYSAKLGFPGLRLINEITSGATEYHPWDSCYGIPFESDLVQENYAEGLGITKYYFEYWTGYSAATWDETLVYYQKGSETWGTPVAADCDVLTAIDNPQPKLERFVSVIPNPAEEEVKVNVSSPGTTSGLQYSLYNSLGVTMKEGNSRTGTFPVSIREFSPGVYLLMVTDTDGTLVGSARIIRK